MLLFLCAEILVISKISVGSREVPHLPRSSRGRRRLPSSGHLDKIRIKHNTRHVDGDGERLGLNPCGGQWGGGRWSLVIDIYTTWVEQHPSAKSS